MADDKAKANKFASEAEAQNVGLVSELMAFLKNNKKWWLLPILVVLFMVGVLVVLGGTGAAPFIYTLF